MNEIRQSQSIAMLFGLAAVLCWSTVATAFKLSLKQLSPEQLILFASLTSAAFLALVLLFQGRLSELWNQPKAVYRTSFLFGLLNPTLYYLLLFWAYDLLPAQEAQAINYSWAIVMTFMAVPVLKQRLHWYDFLAAALCYLGVCLIATRGNLLGLEFGNITGVILAVLSTVVWSSYWVFSRKDQRDPIVGLCLNFVTAIPLIALVTWWRSQGDDFNVTWQGIAGAVYVGLFEMGLAFVLWLSAMKRAENTARLANLIFISPFLSLFFISFFLNEKILPSTLIGLGLIIFGLIAQQVLASKVKPMSKV